MSEPAQTGQVDPVWSDVQVLDIVRRHVPEAHAVTGVDESGGEARVYFVDETLVFKVQRPHRVRLWTSLIKESRLLAAARDAIALPRPLGWGTAHGAEYNLQTLVCGKAMDAVDLPVAQRLAVLREAGKTLRFVHQAPLGEQVMGLFPRMALDDVRMLHEKPLLEALGASPSLDREAIHDVWTRCWDSINSAIPLVPVHVNVASRHIYVDPASGRLTGIIDFGNSHLAPAALDVVRWWPPNECDALLAGYSGAGGVPGEIQGLRSALGLVTAVTTYRRTGEPAARTEIERLMALLAGPG